MYRLSYTAEAHSQINELIPKIQRQLKAAIERIAEHPDIGKRLVRELSGYWSYSSGDYRVIYQVFHKEVVVLIVTVGDRKNVYEKLTRRLS
jgi:mRNA interferase RelE/StbE